IIWPRPVAPFDVHVIALNYAKSETVRIAADGLLCDLEQSGFSVLLDDRDERAGVKFADADLIGIPHRVTVGDRGLAKGLVEYRGRRDATNEEVALSDLAARLG
ncbi:MAG: His/Gly/Thr/Pro-type tRNA ligase C-terminal domain-containing protein, partial [Pseudomonadales bacterium]